MGNFGPLVEGKRWGRGARVVMVVEDVTRFLANWARMLNLAV